MQVSLIITLFPFFFVYTESKWKTVHILRCPKGSWKQKKIEMK